MEMSGKLLYARPSNPIPGLGVPSWQRGSVGKDQGDIARAKVVRAQKEKEHMAKEWDVRANRKTNLHDRLTGKAPIAYIPPKK